ncbi:acetylglutamate kinase [Sinanaerobacter chloroacetimidivorans]|nr:acetylglutamate kinase [Sinanaerobacter chloroacetimidivorans]
MNLINRIRRLMMQLAMWRRAFLISAATDLANLDIVWQRLYRIPSDFKVLFEIFFGEEIAEQFQSSLSNQILIGAEIMDAQKAGDIAAIDDATIRMYQNADELANFLAEINPFWDEEKWKDLLYSYYRITILEMVTVLAGRYEDAIALYEGLEDQALKIGDYMAEGLNEYLSIN